MDAWWSKRFIGSAATLRSKHSKTLAQPEISQWMVKTLENLITPGNITLLRSLGTATSDPSFQKSKKNRGCGAAKQP